VHEENSITSEENSITKEAIVLQRPVWTALWDFVGHENTQRSVVHRLS